MSVTAAWRQATAGIAVLCAASGLRAQTTGERIARGIQAYEALQVNQARTVFREIISPSYQNPVSLQEGVTARKYLGASYAVLGIADSAEQFFISALLYDPFTDLELTKFGELELGPFNVAKSKVFKVGLRPVVAHVLDPADTTTQYAFRYVTTHRANVTLELVNQADPTQVETLLQGVSDGVATYRWNGVLRTRGRIADSTTYFLRIRATSALQQAGGSAPQEQSESQYFRVEHSYAPLEDTLPPLPDSLRLIDEIPAAAPWWDLVKSVLVGGAAGTGGYLAVSSVGRNLSWTTHAVAAAGVTIVSGVASLVYRRANREIPLNVAENARREQQRAEFNADVVARNNAKIAQTKLIITPLTGAR